MEVLGKSLLEYQIERLRQIPSAPSICIATTTNDTDRPTLALAKKLGVHVFCGSEEDVLARYYFAALEMKAEAIVRVTADCPLIDPDIIENIISVYRNSSVDYVSNTLERTYPRGLDAEVFSAKVLKEAFLEATLPAHREHVTPFIRENKERYRLKNISGQKNNAAHRWTVDTSEDFSLIKNLLEAVYPTNPRFRMKDVLAVLAEHPTWSEINAGISQKEEGPR